jgi:transposase InsO family protein
VSEKRGLCRLHPPLRPRQQYSSGEYRELCEALATYKLELIDRQSWSTRARTRTATVHWLEAVYNRQRRHSAIDMLSPVAYEEKFRDRRAAA